MDEVKKFTEMVKHLPHTYASGQWYFTFNGKIIYSAHAASIKSLGADWVYGSLQRALHKRQLTRFDYLEIV